MSLLDINLYKGETPFLQNTKIQNLYETFELLANYNKVVWNLKKRIWVFATNWNVLIPITFTTWWWCKVVNFWHFKLRLIDFKMYSLKNQLILMSTKFVVRTSVGIKNCNNKFPKTLTFHQFKFFKIALNFKFKNHS